MKQLDIEKERVEMGKLLLLNKENEISRQDSILEERLSDLKKQEKKIADGKKILISQNEKIRLKDAVMVSQSDQIQLQKSYLLMAIIVLTLIGVLLFIAIRNYQQKNKVNKVLTEQKLGLVRQKQIIEEAHKEITDSINYAERIQRSFLASKNMLSDNLNEYFILFQPKDVVSGDFYWADKFLNGNFVIAAADSTGHGVPGAIMSILNITSLENAVKYGAMNPAEILNHTRINIIERLKKDGSVEGGKDGMDCSLLSFDFNNNKLSFALANNPLWIIRNNELIEYAPDKMPVGKHDRDAVSFTQQEIDLQKGDFIFIFTDGYADQFGGPKGKKFKYSNLQKLLLENANVEPKIMNEKLKMVFNQWKGDLEQVDDVCIIGIRI